MHLTPVQQWMEIASIYLEGKAEIWFEEFILGSNYLAK